MTSKPLSDDFVEYNLYLIGKLCFDVFVENKLYLTSKPLSDDVVKHNLYLTGKPSSDVFVENKLYFVDYFCRAQVVLDWHAMI